MVRRETAPERVGGFCRLCPMPGARLELACSDPTGERPGQPESTLTRMVEQKLAALCLRVSCGTAIRRGPRRGPQLDSNRRRRQDSGMATLQGIILDFDRKTVVQVMAGEPETAHDLQKALDLARATPAGTSREPRRSAVKRQTLSVDPVGSSVPRDPSVSLVVASRRCPRRWHRRFVPVEPAQQAVHGRSCADSRMPAEDAGVPVDFEAHLLNTDMSILETIASQFTLGPPGPAHPEGWQVTFQIPVVMQFTAHDEGSTASRCAWTGKSRRRSSSSPCASRRNHLTDHAATRCSLCGRLHRPLPGRCSAGLETVACSETGGWLCREPGCEWRRCEHWGHRHGYGAAASSGGFASCKSGSGATGMDENVARRRSHLAGGLSCIPTCGSRLPFFDPGLSLPPAPRPLLPV